METKLDLINKKLPDNVCVQLYKMEDFAVLLPKLSDLWTGIITPKFEMDEIVPWVMSYLTYEIDKENHYLLWIFGDSLEVSEILKEINQFMKDEKENTATIIADLRRENNENKN